MVETKYKSLYRKVNYEFKNVKLLEKSLTHSSFSNEAKNGNICNNERLEFFGDSILSIIVSKYIFIEYPNYPEGDLTKLRAKVVCEEILSMIATKINLGKYLFLGKGEEQTGGRNRKSILADAFEALIAAIYLDGGYENSEKFVISHIKEYIELAVKGKIVIDYKSNLQEFLQSKENTYKMKYIVENEEGPDHNKKFYVSVIVNNKIIGKGHGKSKKIAEQNAAKDAIINFDEFKNN